MVERTFRFGDYGMSLKIIRLAAQIELGDDFHLARLLLLLRAGGGLSSSPATAGERRDRLRRLPTRNRGAPSHTRRPGCPAFTEGVRSPRLPHGECGPRLEPRSDHDERVGLRLSGHAAEY